MRFVHLIFLVFASLQIAYAQVQEAINEFAKFSDFQNASISFKAIDLSNDNIVLGAYNSNVSLPTASTTKLFSTASALEILGSTYKPQTSFYIDGTIDEQGVLNGNLIIKGGGDPTIGSKYFYNENDNSAFLEMAKMLQEHQIKEITGKIIADASGFGYQGAPDGWSWSDLGNYYGAGPSGLCLYDNMLRYNFKTGKAGTTAELKSIFPEILAYEFATRVTSSTRSGDNSYIYAAPFSNFGFATGELPQNQASFVVKGSNPDPEMSFAGEVYSALQSLGIKVNEGYIGNRKLQIIEPLYSFDYQNLKKLFSYQKFNVLEIATETNLHSVNMFAEQLVSLIAYEKTKLGSTSNGINFMTDYWTNKIESKGLHLKDGSGLSRSNGISADNFCSLLKYMFNSKNKDAFIGTLPIAGISGTLKNVCKNQSAHGKLVAKSGTMTRIKSYAGFVNSKSGKTIAFSITVNNYDCSNSVCVDQMEKVFNVMANY